MIATVTAWGTVIDVAQAHQATAQARLAHVQAQGRARTRRWRSSRRWESRPSRSQRGRRLRRKLSKASLQPVERIVSAAIARRPDVLGAYAAEKASAAAVRAAEADFKPKVFMSVSGAYGAAASTSLRCHPSASNRARSISRVSIGVRRRWWA
jgi:outer membrane protein TolC